MRKGIASILANEPDMKLVAEAGSGREAVELFRQHRPDVTLMDLRMPELDYESDGNVRFERIIRGTFAAIAALEMMGHAFSTISLPVVYARKITNHIAGADALIRWTTHAHIVVILVGGAILRCLIGYIIRGNHLRAGVLYDYDISSGKPFAVTSASGEVAKSNSPSASIQQQPPQQQQQKDSEKQPSLSSDSSKQSELKSAVEDPTAVQP